jgi:hypothetical protein
MKNSDHEIEKLLRSAPQPAAPPALEQKLIEDMQTMIARSHCATNEHAKGLIKNKTWFRRWWPALGPAAVSLACAAVLTSQQLEIRSLKQQLQAPVMSVGDSGAAARGMALAASNSTTAAETTATDEQAEIQRLKNLLVKLSQEITRLQKMKTENAQLRQQLAAASFANLTPQEKDELEKAKDKAEMARCVNNLKQIGLAMRVWSLDNEEAYPPNFQVMSNELNTPKILLCPSDTARAEARDFNSFGAGNCSYEYFVPGQDEKPATEPNRVMVRCPIHGNIGLADGSVQSEVARKHPDWLIQRDGKVYFQPSQNQ